MLREKTGHPYTLFGLQQNDGSGYVMMQQVGAASRNDGAVSCHQVMVPGWISGFDVFDTNIPYALLITPTLLQVNMWGNRFASETASEDEMLMGSNYHAAAGDHYFTLISKSQMDIIAVQGSRGTGMDKKPGTFSFEGQAVKPDIPMPNIERVLEAAVEQGLAYRGNTLVELARAAGMQPDALEKSVSRYEELCTLGKDEDFYKNPAYLCPLGSGPYYAITGIPKIYGSLGSVDVNEDTQVLRPDGSVIPGLYATGLESIGVLFDGVAYTQIGGVALGWGFNSGRIAAEHAASTLR
jgi:fumarate reductase flavoprotein subunit